MGWECFDEVKFDLGPSFRVKRGHSNLKVLITRLLLVLEVCNVKPTYRKSWSGNLLIWSDLILGSSFKVKRGQPNLKVLITLILLVLEICNVKPTYRKSWTGNLLLWSDLTLGPCFKVKQWLWWVGFLVDTNLHRFFNALGLVNFMNPFPLRHIWFYVLRTFYYVNKILLPICSDNTGFSESWDLQVFPVASKHCQYLW